MILRRVIDHVRAQNWTAVALDFVIVVTGVFIGLQVANYNDARQLRERESTYLGLLRDDVAAIRNNLDVLMRRSDGLEDAMTRTLRALETCSAEPATPADFQRTFTEYQNILSIQTLNATYNEMVSSGMLAAMRDPLLKRAIVELYTQVEAFNQTVPQIRASMPGVDKIVWDKVRLSYDEDGRPIADHSGFAALCADTALKNAVVEMIDMQHDWGVMAQGVATRIRETENRLGGIADKRAVGVAS